MPVWTYHTRVQGLKQKPQGIYRVSMSAIKQTSAGASAELYPRLGCGGRRQKGCYPWERESYGTAWWLAICGINIIQKWETKNKKASTRSNPRHKALVNKIHSIYLPCEHPCRSTMLTHLPVHMRSDWAIQSIANFGHEGKRCEG